MLSVRRTVRVPVVADILVVAVIIAWALSNDHFGDDGGRGAWIFDIALATPLLWRRRHSVEVFAVISVIALAEWLTDAPASGSLALLVAGYSVGAFESRRWPVVYAAVIMQLGAVMAALRWAPVDHRLVALVLLTGTVTAAWVLGVYARTRRALLTAALERAATAERERDHQTLLATAAERARISREMHDIVAHTLSVMVALSDGAALAVVRDPESARRAIEDSAQLGRQSLTELRRLLGGLHPDDGAELAPAPGVRDVEGLVAAVRAAGLPAELVMSGSPLTVAPALQVAVYRLVQESLTNVLKHASSATHVRVLLSFSPSAVDVEIVNEMDPEGSAAAAPAMTLEAGSGAEVHAGRGLTGMRERVAMFGGWIDAGPLPRGGWQVAARLRTDEESSR